jgi:hypothetical protein
MANYDEETKEEEVVEEQEEETTEELEEVEETEEEEVIDWEARAKKAEAAIIKAKSKPKPAPQAKQSNTEMSHFDLLALNRANIETQEDLDEVVRWADYNKISVSEALQSNILKATIAEKAEKRASANAVNTGTGRRASGQVSDERLLSDAAANKLPTSEEDIARLARLKFLKK